MIWGMALEPGKLYTETMGEEVQLSMASIDSRKDLGAGDGSDRSFSQIVMQTSKGEYVLCTLIHGVMFQQNLDLKIMPREKVTFSVEGSSVVYLVGYTASYPEDEEFDEMREEDLDASEGSSAWEAFESENSQVNHIKQEHIEIVEDQPTQGGEFAVQQEGEPPSQQEGEAPSQDQQQEQSSVEKIEDSNRGEQEEEIIYSVSDLETNVKTEAPDTEPTLDLTMHPQMAPQEAMYSMPVTEDNGTVLQETSTEDYFYPETQLQPEVPSTPIPDAYQSHVGPQGVLTHAPEPFLPPQEPLMQRSQAGPIRHTARRGTMQPMNTQGNCPPQRRRQYGTSSSQPTGKLRSVPQPMNVQEMRNGSNMQQQQSMPGPSEQDVPEPSTSDIDTDVKTEPPDIKSQMPTLESMYCMQATDDGAVLSQTSADPDYFDPDAQQPPNAPLTSVPGEYQPPTSAPGYHPQATPQGVLPPPTEQFLPPQGAMMQRTQAGPVRLWAGRGAMQPVNTQRNYPPQRQKRQYGTNRSQPAGKSKSVPQPMNVQQMRNVGDMPQQQQQSMPGPSQQEVSGPSTSDQENLPPTPVITSSVTASSITIAWEEMAGEPSFYVVIGDGSLVACSKRAYNFSGLDPGTEYSVTVEAVVEGSSSFATKKITTAKPRAGTSKAATAERFKMVELLPGTGVYVHPAQQVVLEGTKKHGQCLTYLVATFFTRDELQASNLKGQNGKQALDSDILEAIGAYQSKRHNIEPRATRRTIAQKCQDAGRKKGESSGASRAKKPLSAKYIQNSSSLDESDAE